MWAGAGEITPQAEEEREPCVSELSLTFLEPFLLRASSLCFFLVHACLPRTPHSTSCSSPHSPPVSAGTCPSPAPALCPAGCCSPEWVQEQPGQAPSIPSLFHMGGAHCTPKSWHIFHTFCCVFYPTCSHLLGPTDTLDRGSERVRPSSSSPCGYPGSARGKKLALPYSPQPRSHMQSFFYR